MIRCSWEENYFPLACHFTIAFNVKISESWTLPFTNKAQKLPAQQSASAVAFLWELMNLDFSKVQMTVMLCGVSSWLHYVSSNQNVVSGFRWRVVMNNLGFDTRSLVQQSSIIWDLNCISILLPCVGAMTSYWRWRIWIKFLWLSVLQDLEPRNTGHDAISGPEHDPMFSPQFPDGLGRQTSTNIPPPEHDPMSSSQFPDGLGRQYSTNIRPPPSSATISTSPPSFPVGDYSSYSADYHPQDYQSSHPSGRPENPAYPQPYRTQSYSQEPPHPPHLPQNYPSQDTPASYAYPNFQSYPSFSDSSLPAAPSHYPSYYQGSDASYSHHSVPSGTNYSSASEYNSSSTNGNAPHVPTATAQVYHYDSNYQVPPEKIADAQKAARFAVGALAFDEVPVAVEHLKKALELLTNPSAGQ